MKKLFKYFTTVIFSLAFTVSVACNRADFTLDSWSFDGTNYTINTTLCIGGGAPAGIGDWGGDNPTGWMFSIAFWFNDNTNHLISNSPSQITGDSTGVTYDAYTYGNIYPLGEDANATWEDIDMSNNIMCVFPRSLCGYAAHTQCWNLTFVTSILPDSMRALGIEGSWPYGGCYGESDMKIDFTGLPLILDDFQGYQVGNTIKLDWSAYNNSMIAVFKLSADSSFGLQTTTPNSSWVDLKPKEGLNYYKLVSTDFSTESEVITVQFSRQSFISIGPNPTEGLITINCSKFFSCSLFTTSGKFLESFDSKLVDISKYSSGIYLLKIESEFFKVIKL